MYHTVFAASAKSDMLLFTVLAASENAEMLLLAKFAASEKSRDAANYSICSLCNHRN